MTTLLPALQRGSHCDANVKETQHVTLDAEGICASSWFDCLI
uniref:Uncharacterized protein n=1 Tax=Anguilla anguilla TaxID=7936 RepID=A0A0E9PKT0_ANGAN